MGTMQKPPTMPSTPSGLDVPYRVDRLTGIRWHPRRGHIWRPRLGAVVCFYKTPTTFWGHPAQCDRCGRRLDDLRTLATEDGAPLVSLPPALVRYIRERARAVWRDEDAKWRPPLTRLSRGKAEREVGF